MNHRIILIVLIAISVLLLAFSFLLLEWKVAYMEGWIERGYYLTKPEGIIGGGDSLEVVPQDDSPVLFH